ncbi:chemotaxis protein CheW [soil metagenome]
MSDSQEVDEIVKEFLVESYEGLDQLDRDLIALEHSGTDKELLARIFRCVHTVKGTCGFLGYTKLESVTHVGESLLSKLRDGALGEPTPELTTALLALVDAIRQMLGHIETAGSEGAVDYGTLIADLSRLQGVTETVATEPADDEPAQVPRGVSPPIGELLIDAGQARAADVAAALHEQRAGRNEQIGEILVKRGVASQVAVNEALEAQNDTRTGSVSDTSIRVDVSLLDKLMTLVGELVLARNQILQYSNASTQASSLTTASQRLNLLTTELQEGVMKTRMQPIGNIWSKLPRVVRDLALACNKQIRLDMEGRETELDRTIIEAIKDPLTHIARNAADHGIEDADERVACGKPAEGRLLLRAFHEGGQVIVEISDDGRGLDPERLKIKAIEKGVITHDQASRMSDREALNLIFLAGFSTAAKVTNISGRGVGMDVVKTNIEKIGGVVDVQSVLGQGTTLKIKIPLTLAIIPGLIVTTCGDRYAIPQVNLLELMRLEGADARQGIEMIYGVPVYRLRGNLLPLVHLNHALGFSSTPWAPDATEVVNIVVLQADGTPFGLVVDAINDTEEIVVKPLGRQLKGIAAFAGATIMGDGRVALILDVLGLAQQGGVLAAARERAATGHATDARADQSATQTLLLFGFGNRRMAVPLSAIARLEVFNRTSVEFTGKYEVVQYRDRIMPLVRLRDVLDGIAPASEDTELLQVVVYSHRGHSVGLVVDTILDIVQTQAAIERRRGGGSVQGSTVIQGKVTDILNMDQLVQSLDTDLLGQFTDTPVAVGA